MSSRALRKLQKERDKQKAQVEEAHNDSDDEYTETFAASKKINAFDMLNTAEDEGKDGEESEDDAKDGNDGQEVTKSSPPGTEAVTSRVSKKKKKKKKKNNAKSKESDGKKEEKDELDEIDQALRELSTKDKSSMSQTAQIRSGPSEFSDEQLLRLLSVESKHLNALNEMKRLFGNVVLEPDMPPDTQPRRRGRGPRQLDLAAALTAQNSPVSKGQGLSGLILRKNFFMQGKEEWPKASGGGLGMDCVESFEDETVEYRFEHNSFYQDTQRKFQMCVDSMDPQAMISMLVLYPYHISTLLQVSEIAKHQGDLAVSADLLERTLFTFGRSVHSGFTRGLSTGRARLDFNFPENREFWLASWRYMINLGQRGTWRTAYEWAKLILSLDPELDPFCIGKVIDQYAIRGGQCEHYLELVRSKFYDGEGMLWWNRPNLHISSALAEYRLKQTDKAHQTLSSCVRRFPWVFTRLFQELNIERVPKSIWGKEPRSPMEKLNTEEYVHNAKDIWNTPETVSFLVEVVEWEAGDFPGIPADDRNITLDDARYAVLSGVPSIIECIPRHLTNQSTSSFDPFPPATNNPRYLVLSNGDSGDHEAEAASWSDSDELTEDSEGLGSRESGGMIEELQLELERSPVQRQSRIQRILGMVGLGFAGAGVRETTQGNSSGNDDDEGFEGDDAATDDDMPPLEPAPSTLPSANPPQASSEDHTPAPTTADPPAASPPVQAQNAPIRPSRDLSDEEVSRILEEQFEIYNDGEGPPFLAPRTANPPPPGFGANRPNHQNWLAGRGIQLLKTLTTEHGLDPSRWPSSSSSDSSSNTAEGNEAEDGTNLDGHALLTLYATRLLDLPDASRRSFIFQHVLSQVAGVGVKILVAGEQLRITRERGISSPSSRR